MTTLLSFLTKRRSFLMGLISMPVVAAAQAAEGQPAASTGDKPLYEKPFAAFQGKTLEQKVQEIADREEIRELVAKYALRVAHGVSPADLFTDDGSFITQMPNGPDLVAKGRKDLDKTYGAIAATGAGHTLPMIHNHLIEISGHEATGTCSIELRNAMNGKSMIGSGYYNDRYRKEDGRWRFVLRDARFFHMVPLQEGWVKAG
jgi:hypothetical protein